MALLGRFFPIFNRVRGRPADLFLLDLYLFFTFDGSFPNTRLNVVMAVFINPHPAPPILGSLRIAACPLHRM